MLRPTGCDAVQKEELQRTAAEEQVAALTSRLAASQDQHKTEAVALSAEVEDLKVHSSRCHTPVAVQFPRPSATVT